MVEGELIQLTFNGNLDITEEQHLDISMRKTAFLFSACSQLGGILGSAGEEKGRAPASVRPECRTGVPAGRRCPGFHVERKHSRETGRKRSEGREADAPSHLPDARRRTAPPRTGPESAARERIRMPRTGMRFSSWSGSTAPRIVCLEKAHDYAQKAKDCLKDFPACQARRRAAVHPRLHRRKRPITEIRMTN